MPRIGTGELARPRRVGADHDAGQRIDGRIAGQSGQLHVAETVEGEPRLPAPRRRPCTRRCRPTGAAEVGRVERAVGIEHLGVPQRDLRARRGRRPSAAPRRPCSGRDRKSNRPGLGSTIRLGLDGRRSTRTGSMTWPSSGRGGSSRTRGRRPRGVVQPGLVPAGVLQPRIVRFAQHEVGRQRSGCRRSATSASVTMRSVAAVGVGHFQLGQQGRLLAQHLEPAVADVAAVPAVAQQGGHGVVARLEQRARRRRPGSGRACDSRSSRGPARGRRRGGR